MKEEFSSGARPVYSFPFVKDLEYIGRSTNFLIIDPKNHDDTGLKKTRTLQRKVKSRDY